MVAKQHKILIVDDEELNAEFLRILLQKKGYATLVADGGALALELIRKENPDLVLLDAMMPEIDGFEVCRRLRAQTRTKLLPIIMVTALQSEEDENRALNAGADDFLSKPVNTFELHSRIRSLLRIKTLHDELAEVQTLRDSLTQMIVHDLKNPLTGIMGCCELLLLLQDSMTPEQLSLVKKIEDNTMTIAKMTNEIIDVSRMEENKLNLKRESFSVREVLEANVSELQIMLKKYQLNCEIEADPGLPLIYADRDIFHRVVANLLYNAIKHSFPKGLIKIRALKSTDRMTISIEDNGEGIPAEYRDKIFEKFAQSDQRVHCHSL